MMEENHKHVNNTSVYFRSENPMSNMIASVHHLAASHWEWLAENVSDIGGQRVTPFESPKTMTITF